MKYQVEIARSAEREARRLPQTVQFRFARAFRGLELDPRPPGSKRLAGTSGLWRIRVGAYRAIYLIEDTIKLVRIEKIGHRGEVYR